MLCGVIDVNFSNVLKGMAFEIRLKIMNASKVRENELRDLE